MSQGEMGGLRGEDGGEVARKNNAGKSRRLVPCGGDLAVRRTRSQPWRKGLGVAEPSSLLIPSKDPSDQGCCPVPQGGTQIFPLLRLRPPILRVGKQESHSVLPRSVLSALKHQISSQKLMSVIRTRMGLVFFLIPDLERSMNGPAPPLAVLSAGACAILP